MQQNAALRDQSRTRSYFHKNDTKTIITESHNCEIPLEIMMDFQRIARKVGLPF